MEQISKKLEQTKNVSSSMRSKGAPEQVYSLQNVRLDCTLIGSIGYEAHKTQVKGSEEGKVSNLTTMWPHSRVAAATERPVHNL